MDALINIYRRKYPKHDPMIVFRSMIYFDDAEEPDTLNDVGWDKIKEFITTSAQNSSALKSDPIF